MERVAPRQRTAPSQGRGARSPPRQGDGSPRRHPRAGAVLPRLQSATGARTDGRTNVGTLLVVADGDQRAGPSRDRERRVAGHPNYQAMAEETDAAW